MVLPPAPPAGTCSWEHFLLKLPRGTPLTLMLWATLSSLTSFIIFFPSFHDLSFKEPFHPYLKPKGCIKADLLPVPRASTATSLSFQLVPKAVVWAWPMQGTSHNESGLLLLPRARWAFPVLSTLYWCSTASWILTWSPTPGSKEKTILQNLFSMIRIMIHVPGWT